MTQLAPKADVLCAITHDDGHWAVRGHTRSPLMALSNLGKGPRRCESKSPFVTMVRPKFAPKSTPSRGPIHKPHYICLIPGPVRPMMPNGIRIRFAVFPQCTGQTDAPTDARTDRSFTGKFLTTIGRYASNESDAA